MVTKEQLSKAYENGLNDEMPPYKYTPFHQNTFTFGRQWNNRILRGTSQEPIDFETKPHGIPDIHPQPHASENRPLTGIQRIAEVIGISI